jgi:membrane protein
LDKRKTNIKSWLIWVLSGLKRVGTKIVLPGFQGISLYETAVFFIGGLRKGSLVMRANSVSFSFMMALFPTIIFFFSLIPFIPIDNLYENIMLSISNALPDKVFHYIQQTVEEIIGRQRGEVLSLGFLLAIYFSSNGVAGLMKGFNLTTHTVETRSKWQLFIISLFLVFIIALILIISTTLLIFSSWFIKLLMGAVDSSARFTFILVVIAKWVILFMMILMMISTIYYLAPSGKRPFRFISAGSMLATILSLVFMMAFNYYIDNFSQYNKLYGSLGTLIILMLWINFNAIVLLIGFELNASIHEATSGHASHVTRHD